jgi:AraC-like DNA-binding protein/DNA-binding transcriptional MerR regulator
VSRGLLDISEVRTRSGLAASALHYYERQGLIRSVERAGLRRQYEAETIDRLAVIALCQRAGLRLEEIAKLLAVGGRPVSKDLLRAKQAEVYAKIQALNAVERSLTHALGCPSGHGLHCEHFRAEIDAVIPLRPKARAARKRPGTAKPGPPAAVQHMDNLTWLRRVRDRIDREYAQPLDVEALARGAHMSAGHLSREFKLAYGESPYSYLMTRRIERAMALLRSGDLSVTKICFAVGCSSLGTFSTRFAELVGMSPGAYRRQARRASAGVPSCIAKQVSRPVRNREAPAAQPLLA